LPGATKSQEKRAVFWIEGGGAAFDSAVVAQIT
jgi:hypothetical protein